MDGQGVFLITGIPAAGKSTVAELLAELLPQSVHVRGDLFRRMVVSGRAEMTPAKAPEAVRQLRLRYRLTAMVTDAYADAGFTVVAQDVVMGTDLAELVATLRSRPLRIVVLAPNADAVAAREAARAKTAYGEWTVEELDKELRETTPRIGLWIDSSDQAPRETVEEIVQRVAEAVI